MESYVLYDEVTHPDGSVEKIYQGTYPSAFSVSQAMHKRTYSPLCDRDFMRGLKVDNIQPGVCEVKHAKQEGIKGLPQEILDMPFSARPITSPDDPIYGVNRLPSTSDGIAITDELTKALNDKIRRISGGRFHCIVGSNKDKSFVYQDIPAEDIAELCNSNMNIPPCSKDAIIVNGEEYLIRDIIRGEMDFYRNHGYISKESY